MEDFMGEGRGGKGKGREILSKSSLMNQTMNRQWTGQLLFKCGGTIASNYTRKCVDSLIITERQIKTTLRSCLIPGRVATIQKLKALNSNESWRERNPCIVLMGRQIGPTTLKFFWRVCKIPKPRISIRFSCPTSGSTHCLLCSYYLRTGTQGYF